MARRPLASLGALGIAATLVVLVGCAAASVSLDGTQWRLTGWTVSSIDPAAVTITADFADGQISGNSGVNSYSGPCTVGPGEAFSAGPLAATLMAGEEPAMRAETAYLTLVGQAKSYKVQEGTLTLFDAGGNESLIFASATK